MVATPVKIGPFAGGLNSYSDATAVGDAELTDVQNFEIDFDGSLYTRTPITKLDQPTLDGILAPLGWFIDTDGTRYLILNAEGNGVYARNETTGVYTLITSTFTAGAYVQYAKKAWLIAPPSSANPGGSWTPAGGFVTTAAIPKGTTAGIYKERLFIGGDTVNPNRVYFSNAADFAVWNTSVNFFDVRAGDGQNIVAIQVFQDVIAIFKDDSTYLFSYDSNPSRGVARVINNTVGITNKRCIVEYETSLYIIHEGKLYQISNWNFTLVNLKVPFEQNILYVAFTSYRVTLSLMSDRLVVHFYDNIYVFNLRIGTWTKWHVETDRLFSYFIEVPRMDTAETERYYGGCRQPLKTGNTNRVLYEWRPTHDAVRSESITAFFNTKVYDFNVPYSFKRLFWWGADIVSGKDINYTVQPVVFSPSVTHQDLNAYNHGDIVGSHLRPLSISLNVGGTETVQNTSAYRMFIKFIKSLRFRQISFTIGGTTDGTTNQGPLRAFSVIAFVDNKAIVSAKVS